MNAQKQFMIAAISNSIEELKELINDGIDINWADTEGHKMTALMYACFNDHIDVVKLLIKHKVNMSIKRNYDGKTALMYAVQEGHYEITKLLIENDCDIFSKCLDGKSALNIGLLLNHEEIIELLLFHYPTDYKFKDGKPAAPLKTVAYNISLKCAIPFDTPVSLTELEAIENKLNCNIYVLNLRDLPLHRTETHVYNSLLYYSENKETRKYWWLFDEMNKHFHVITDIRKFLHCSYFCEKMV
jgi:hypothetical protein